MNKIIIVLIIAGLLFTGCAGKQVDLNQWVSDMRLYGYSEEQIQNELLLYQLEQQKKAQYWNEFYYGMMIGQSFGAAYNNNGCNGCGRSSVDWMPKP